MTFPRIATQYSLHRSATGRLASGLDDTEEEHVGKREKKQQLQNVPKKLRDGIVADDGHVLVGGDWAGIEWAIAMWMCSQVPGADAGYYEDMLDRFWLNEFDAHQYLADIASKASGKVILRQVCKAYTHGYTFDGTANGLADVNGHPRRVGQLVCAGHDRAFRTQDWKDWTYEECLRRKFVETPLGWRIYFWGWKPKRQEVLGNLVQATAADLCKVALLACFEDDRWNLPYEPHAGALLTDDGPMITSTHDSLVAMVPKAQGEEALAWMKEKMEAPVPWLGGRRWRADVKLGKNWRAVS